MHDHDVYSMLYATHAGPAHCYLLSLNDAERCQ